MSKSIMYDLYHGCISQSSDFEQLDAFSYGFKLATMLMCAVFADENEPTLSE